MQEIHCVVLRLEDALTNQFLDIPGANLSILEYLAEKGVVLGLTSRSSAAKVESWLEKKNIRDLFSFVIGANGCEYLNLKTGQTQILHTLNAEDLRRAAKRVRSLPVSLGVFNGHGFAFDKPGLFALHYAWRRMKPLRCRGFQNQPENEEYYKFIVTGSKPLLDRMEKHLSLPGMRSLRYTDNIVDLIPEAANPWQALQIGLAEFGIQPENTLSFSSHNGDEDIMKHTFAIGMKSLPETLKPYARRIAKYNAAQNGISYMINSLILENNCVYTKPHTESEQ